MRLIKYIIILVFILFIGWQYFYNRAVNLPLDLNTKKKTFVVKKGESVKNISSNLKKADIINSEMFFSLYLKKEKLETKLQAGEYMLGANMSIVDIAKVLSEGNAVNQEKEIKIIEGWTIKEMDNYFDNKNLSQSGDFIKLTKGVENFTNYVFLKKIPKKSSLEGYLFPDTYRVFNNASIKDVVIKMLDNFDNKLTEKMREDIRAQGKTIHEIVTMASVIEKEVRNYNDMKLVSGIFWNRINSRQRLESCATLAYILGVNKKQYTLEDTKIDSLYNTYLHNGLPPGPISNPGINAIKAAIYPTKTDYFYFLSRFDNGETVFSKTYEEHTRNKAKYLR